MFLRHYKTYASSLTLLSLFFVLICCSITVQASDPDLVVQGQTTVNMGSSKEGFLEGQVRPFYHLTLKTGHYFSSISEILHSTGTSMQLSLVFLFSQKEHAFRAYCERFIVGNHDNATLEREQIRIEQFLEIIDRPFLPKDNIIIELIPEKGVSLRLNQQKIGFIRGEDFFSVILKMWLGPNPPAGMVHTDLVKPLSFS